MKANLLLQATRRDAAVVQDAVRIVRNHTDQVPDYALVLGSGLGELASLVEGAVVISTHDLPGYPRSTVAGHSGRLVIGTLEGCPVAVVQGRVHLYEGYPVHAVTFPVRLVHALGARRLLVTNAAGGIHPALKPGTLMLISDHINLTFGHPLAHPDRPALRCCPNRPPPYDPLWLEQAARLAGQLGLAVQQGTYLWTPGPSYETKAEIRAFARLGADAVGMSTVPEVLQARALGMRVLGVSTITNPAAGISLQPLDHADVLAVGRRVQADLQHFIRAIIRET